MRVAQVIMDWWGMSTLCWQVSLQKLITWNHLETKTAQASSGTEARQRQHTHMVLRFALLGCQCLENVLRWPCCCCPRQQHGAEYGEPRSPYFPTLRTHPELAARSSGSLLTTTQCRFCGWVCFWPENCFISAINGLH